VSVVTARNKLTCILLSVALLLSSGLPPQMTPRSRLRLMVNDLSGLPADFDAKQWQAIE